MTLLPASVSRFLVLLLIAVPLARAASPASDAVLQSRADKIVAPLGVGDAVKQERVRDRLVRQYRELGQVHAERDAKLKQVQAEHGGDKAALAQASQAIKAETEKAQDKLHAAFLSDLAVDLSPAQIDQVKDGMTYGVLPLTYRVYLEMLPNLKDQEKAQILAWLTEAREHAMDAGSSEEKHGWFGKYKGRIVNYLTKAGYDLKQAQHDLMAKKKAATPSSK